MRYVIGYQIHDEMDSTYELVKDFSDSISGVYFSLPGAASARSVIDPVLKEDMFEELRAIRALDKKLVLLFNANCYGHRATSDDFRQQIIDQTALARREFDVLDITTTSPFVAKVIKEAFPEVNVCASVNMRVGSIAAMRLLNDFDSYYLQREYIHDFKKIEEMKSWCDENGKTLRLIANSGCIYDCPFHTFHDNLVAHEAEMHEGEDTMQYPSPCWETMHRYKAKEAAALFLQGNWIRPEDIRYYEPYFEEAKLATRMHAFPRRVISAYARGRFKGNLFDLTEPAYSVRFKYSILDATCMPEGYFRQRLKCDHNCEKCGYCLEVARQALKDKFDLEETYLHSI